MEMAWTIDINKVLDRQADHHQLEFHLHNQKNNWTFETDPKKQSPVIILQQ